MFLIEAYLTGTQGILGRYDMVGFDPRGVNATRVRGLVCASQVVHLTIISSLTFPASMIYFS
jgi:hypothetical protein